MIPEKSNNWEIEWSHFLNVNKSKKQNKIDIYQICYLSSKKIPLIAYNFLF